MQSIKDIIKNSTEHGSEDGLDINVMRLGKYDDENIENNSAIKM